MTKTTRCTDLFLAAAALAVVLHFGAPAFAQQAGGGNPPAGDGAAKEEEVAKIPAAVLSGLLTGTPEALLALKQYLAAVSASPDEVSKRALNVVQQLKDSGLVRDPALIVAAAERVSQAVKSTLSSAKIVQLKVDRNFKPPPGTVALDFAPADAKVRPGFKRVLPTDASVKGKQVQGIRRPGDDEDLLADGITGIEEISLDMPDGEYRITLMTESIGDATTSLSPFGQSIMANGQSFDVLQATPDAWLKQAVLSNQGLAGFNTATSRQGGAMTLTVTVTGGKLDLGFNFGTSGGALKTYLTGMLVEPAASPSVFTALPEMQSSLTTPRETQARYESQLASSISTILERTTPNAGPGSDDILKPVQTVKQASPY